MSHFTVLTNDVPATERFYCDLLGLEVGWRPDFNFPGLWLYSAGVPILHVIGGRTEAELRAGVIDHMAFDAVDLPTTVERLKNQGVKYELRRTAGSAQGIWQLFCFDPNGAKVELDFKASESPPA
jgi:catechol 2,3-dioxygenase-like lactoylglutathione lyase family enzyme